MQLYGFTARDCDRLHALLAAYEQGRIRVDVPTFAPRTQQQQDSFLGATSGTITAGHTGTATMVDLTTAIPPGQTLLSSIPSLSVFNPSSSDLPAGTYLFTLEPSQGYYVPAFAAAPAISNNAGATSSSVGLWGLTSGSWTTYPYLTVNLPSAGTYLLWMTVCMQIDAPAVAASSGEASAILYDQTNTSQIGASVDCCKFSLGSTNLGGFSVQASGSVLWPHIASGAATIGFQAFLSSTGGSTAYVVPADTSGTGCTSMGYLKIG